MKCNFTLTFKSEESARLALPVVQGFLEDLYENSPLAHSLKIIGSDIVADGDPNDPEAGEDLFVILCEELTCNLPATSFKGEYYFTEGESGEFNVYARAASGKFAMISDGHEEEGGEEIILFLTAEAHSQLDPDWEPDYYEDADEFSSDYYFLFNDEESFADGPLSSDKFDSYLVPEEDIDLEYDYDDFDLNELEMDDSDLS